MLDIKKTISILQSYIKSIFPKEHISVILEPTNTQISFTSFTGFYWVIVRDGYRWDRAISAIELETINVSPEEYAQDILHSFMYSLIQKGIFDTSESQEEEKRLALVKQERAKNLRVYTGTGNQEASNSRRPKLKILPRKY